jgi:hypothetical protein
MSKQVPLAEVTRLRDLRRKLQAEVARLEAEKQGWLVEKAQLISALGKRLEHLRPQGSPA